MSFSKYPLCKYCNQQTYGNCVGEQYCSYCNVAFANNHYIIYFLTRNNDWASPYIMVRLEEKTTLLVDENNESVTFNFCNEINPADVQIYKDKLKKLMAFL